MNKEPIKLKIKELDPDMIAPSTATMNKETQGGTKTVIIGKPGCFEPGTQVLMYNGDLCNVENVKLGDLVMGDDSTPRTVLQLCSERENMYKIVLQGLNSDTKKSFKSIDRGSYTVNEGHSLVLVNKKGTTIEISVRDFLQKSEDWKKNWYIFRKGVDFTEKNIEIDPYLIGLILANDGLKYLDKNVERWIKQYTYVQKIDLTELSNYSTTLYYKDYIPLEYKINNRYNRLRLLAGIIDSDGLYDNHNNKYCIFKFGENLAYDILFLAKSLGFDAFLQKLNQKCQLGGETYSDSFFQITIGGGTIYQIPVLVPSKSATLEEKDNGYIPYKFTVEYVGEGDYYGFVLDGNHRFLLGSFDVVRNTGKSTLITSLLYEKSHIYTSGMVCSGTEDSNHHYSQSFPETFIYNKLEKQKVEDFVKRQKIARQHLPNPWSVLLLDDCTDDPKLFVDPLFQNIFKNGRHYKMWFILSLQYCLDVKPVIRTNIDGTFILRETNLRNRKSLWENYAGVIPDFTMFCEIMDQLTNDYTALYINNATTSNKLEDCIFWYKAKPVPKDFKFGSQDYWDFHNSRFDEHKSIL